MKPGHTASRAKSCKSKKKVKAGTAHNADYGMGGTIAKEMKRRMRMSGDLGGLS